MDCNVKEILGHMLRVCVCSLLCVCTLDGLNAEHKFRVWVTILGRMSRHFTLYFTLLFWSYSHTDVACKTDVWAAMRLAHHSDNCNLQINIKSKSVQQFNFYIMIYLHHPKTNIKGLTSHPYPTGSPNGFGFQFGHQGSSVVRRYCSNDVHQPWLCRETILGWCLRLDSIKTLTVLVYRYTVRKKFKLWLWRVKMHWLVKVNIFSLFVSLNQLLNDICNGHHHQFCTTEVTWGGHRKISRQIMLEKHNLYAGSRHRSLLLRTS